MSPRRRSAAEPEPGIEIRHSKRCATTGGEACDCTPTYRAWVSSRRDRSKIRRTFKTLEAARLWRQDAQVDLRRGQLSKPKPLTVAAAAEAWTRGVKSGAIRNRSGNRYKPSAIRGYEQALRDYVLPAFGSTKLSELRRADVQRLADQLVEEGLSASTVRNALMPLRAICRRALTRGDIQINPTLGLELPAQDAGRDRVASPEEGAILLAALPESDRAIWATAMYAGLRLGELQALHWDDIDFERGIIRVRRSWDRHEGEVDPKSKAGTRSVPIAAILRRELIRHRGNRTGEGFAFGRSADRPFSASGVVYRAYRLWRAASLEPIGLHECRHTFASLMIAAGVNIKALQVFMGHSTITVTLDLYAHLLPGSEDEAAALLDAYMQKALTADPLRGPHAGQTEPSSGGFQRS